MTKSLRLSRVLLSRGHALCWGWLRAGCNHTLLLCLGQVPQTASPSHQPKPAASDPRSGVFNMCEKCDAACSRDLGHEGGYAEPSPA